jgi:UDP-N-acetylmuramate dehydrogenase
MIIQNDFNLLPYNTFGLSSVAERLVQIETKSELQSYFESNEPLPSLVLGGGSNLLLTRDIPGTVLKVEIPGIEVISETDDHVFVRVGAGVVWHEFVIHCTQQNWGGAENLSLIPGNVGAAPMQNIGAYGGEIKSIFHELEAYLSEDKAWGKFSLADCAFGYRESIFKRKLRNKAVISTVTFRLNKKPEFNTTYGAIDAELEKMGVKDITIKAISDAVISIRQSKLPDPKKIGNSGSFFKNPVIDTMQFEKLKAEYPTIVGYPAGDKETKVAAGWLIETAGFKGKRYGNYGVHDKQALVLVNYGGATGQQVFDLSTEIIETISAQFGIELEREVNII